MGDFPAIPTKEELYAKVNDWFYATNPDAPEPLDPKDPSQAEWRRTWMRHRDELLNAEVDRVYWDAYPEAPREIDESKPEHRAYQKAWWDIRTWILDMTPEMAPLDGDNLERAQQTALEDVRDHIWSHAENLVNNMPADLQPPVADVAESAIEQIQTAYRNGLVGEDVWRGTTTELKSGSDPGKWVKVTPTAKVENGRVAADLDQVFSD